MAAAGGSISTTANRSNHTKQLTTSAANAHFRKSGHLSCPRRAAFKEGTPLWLRRATLRPGESVPAEEYAKWPRKEDTIVGFQPSSASVKWKCTIRSTSDLLGDNGKRLSLQVIDAHKEIRSEVIDVDLWRPPKKITRSDGTTGWEREGAITLPATIKAPGAVLVRKGADKGDGKSLDYIESIILVSPTSIHTVNANSWVSPDHGWRVFFSGFAYLPKDTPIVLRGEREAELKALQGNEKTRDAKRKLTDRIYWYQEYSDLSGDKSGNMARPILGNSVEWPYPRRLATNRGNLVDGREKPPPAGEGLWLQLDEQFSYDKSRDFNGTALQGGLAAAFTAIQEAAESEYSGSSPLIVIQNFLAVLRNAVSAALAIGGQKPPTAEIQPLMYFEDFKDVIAIYKKASGNEFEDLLPTNLYLKESSNGLDKAATKSKKLKKKSSRFRTEDGGWDFELKSDVAAVLDNEMAEKRVGPAYDMGTRKSATASSSSNTSSPAPEPVKLFLNQILERVKDDTQRINKLLQFNVPRVLEGRPDAWHSDEEFGRQIVAGYNPVTISALKKLPETFGSAIRGEHINADLQGATLEELVKIAADGGKPRLYYIDYWDLSHFWNEGADKGINEGKVQHAGRVVMYLRHDGQGNDVGLIPVAIELAHRKTHKKDSSLLHTAGVVYSRHKLAGANSTLAVWRLAKMIFKSLDSSFHQLISHWNRTHCALEPFHIAMRRQISVMHPVSKLMLPHFRYTLQINVNARANLIESGGVIEDGFSAGSFAMRLASVVYRKYWNFTTEALPKDLEVRGMVDPTTGKPWLDYPYAVDGMDMWNALTEYFDSYLRLYYKSDDDVLADTEVQAWWKEVKDYGHPDLIKFGLRNDETQLWGFKGRIKTIEKLVRVLVTIAWLASGHHAAINFGQYDYTSFILNAPSKVRKPMPKPGDDAWTELTSAKPQEQERIILTYLTDPLTAAKVASTVMVLSGHSRDEHTLDEVNEQLVDPEARKANQAFIAAMKKLESDIEMRNTDSANWARFGLAMGDKAGPLQYTLLSPGSRAGVTMRGVPYSVSI